MSNDHREGGAERGRTGAEGARPQISTSWAEGQSEERAELLRELISANRAYQSAVEKMDEAFCRLLGVNRTDGRCLDVIDQRPGLTAGELATAVGLSRGAVTTALDRLEQRGFVRRTRDSEGPSAGDGRADRRGQPPGVGGLRPARRDGRPDHRARCPTRISRL